MHADSRMSDKAYISWIILCFMAVYVPFVLYTPPSLYGMIFFPEWLSSWYTRRICIQVACLIPLLLIWSWNAGLTWNRKLFLLGFISGGGWMILPKLLAATFYNPGPYALPAGSNAAILFSIFSLAFTGGLFALKAKSSHIALAIGFVCLVGQTVIFYLAIGQFELVS